MYRKPQSAQESDQGYIYVLINPSMEGLVKVGKTTRDPSQRVKELSTPTSVPTPFILVYQAKFIDCSEAEQHIHQELAAKGYRYSSNREFFIAPVNEIIDIIIKEKQSPVNAHSANVNIPSNRENGDNDDIEPGQAILKLAWEYINGSGDTIKDPKEAFLLTTKAVKMGNKEAYSLLSVMYFRGYSVKQNTEKAKDVLKQGIDRGLFTCWADLAILYKETERDNTNSEKCWKRFFLSLKDFDLWKSKDKYSYVKHVLKYLYSQYDDHQPIEYLEEIRPIREIISNYMKADIKVCEEDNKLEELDKKKKIYEWFTNAMIR